MRGSDAILPGTFVLILRMWLGGRRLLSSQPPNTMSKRIGGGLLSVICLPRKKNEPIIEEVEQPVEVVPPSTLAMVLMGTIVGPDGLERAIIYDKTQRKQQIYQQGDAIEQTLIKQIFARQSGLKPGRQRMKCSI
jgi:type II secretory pathway component PulC